MAAPDKSAFILTLAVLGSVLVSGCGTSAEDAGSSEDAVPLSDAERSALETLRYDDGPPPPDRAK